MPPKGRRYKSVGDKNRLNTSTWSDTQRAEYELQKKYQTPIAELSLPVRVINTLEDNNVILVEHLLAQTYETLMRMKNFGDTTLLEVKNAVQALGLPVPAWQKTPKVKARKPKRKNG